MIKTKVVLFLIIISITQFAIAQKKIALSFDDVPNLRNVNAQNYPRLLSVLDSLHIPLSIFVNESRLAVADTQKASTVFTHWVDHPSIILGNHTYNHKRYSKVGFDEFFEDVKQGEEFLKTYLNKNYIYFRFPYNDLGEGEEQQLKMIKELKKSYTIAPFTVESSDWMYNSLYRKYQKIGDEKNATRIGKAYVEHTLKMIDYFSTMTEELYNRNISHIYLAHDNHINSDYIDAIILGLKERDFVFINLDEAMKDPIYNQKNGYYKKWGVSWLYRWMDDENRSSYMKNEPDMKEIIKEFNAY